MVDFDETLALERHQQAEDRARVEASLFAEFGSRKITIVRQERAQEGQRPLNRADLIVVGWIICVGWQGVSYGDVISWYEMALRTVKL